MKEEIRKKIAAGSSVIDDETKNELIKLGLEQARASFIKNWPLPCLHQSELYMYRGSLTRSSAAADGPTSRLRMILRINLVDTMCLTVVLIALLIAELVCRDAEVAAADVTPPPKPAIFRTVEELDEYLHRLNEYYTIIGRPRFG
jgi:hypothetical protein